MIKDNINNYFKYIESFSEDIIKGFEFILKTDFNDVADGKHIISENIFVNIQTYETKSDADFEAHREYVDIQYIISGEEKIGVVKYADCNPLVPYNKKLDIEFLSGNGEFYPLEQSQFMLLYPEDAHKPSISINSSKTVRKAVVKVKI